MKRYLLAQKAREIFGYKLSVFRACYDEQRTIFIHIPKCAGTSINHTLYGHSTWHWTAAELRFINKKKFNRYFKFSVVRNPYDRLYSTYLYASVDAAKFIRSPLQFMTKFNTFESFVINGLSEQLVNQHYFLANQTEYLTNNGEAIKDITIGRFEELNDFLVQLNDKIPALANIKKLNQSSNRQPLIEVYTHQMIEKVSQLYRSDIETFNYSFPYP